MDEQVLIMGQEMTELTIPTVFTRRLLMSYLIAACFETRTEALELLITWPVYTNSRSQLADESSSSRSGNVMRHFVWSGGKFSSGKSLIPGGVDDLMIKYVKFLQIRSGMMTSEMVEGFSQNSSTDSQMMHTDQIHFQQISGEFTRDLTVAENRDSESREWTYSIDSIPDSGTSVVMVIGAGILACTVRRPGIQNLTKHKVFCH